MLSAGSLWKGLPGVARTVDDMWDTVSGLYV